MERKVLAYIKQNRMIGKKDMVLAGVSGGSDSMAMLHILKELQEKLDFTLRVVHVHHGIRGKEADRDRSFVENICRKWQIPCTVYCYDVPGLSREWKLGEEETGRIVRKEAFQREAAVCGMKIKIALAHNQEDLAETMLHNLCRGTGLRGLCTMRPADGEIIRPILCLSREKITGYLKEKKIQRAIATATDTERAARYLKQIGLYEYFDRIICANMVKCGKPSPDIYIYACQQLGLDPSACMAVEDSPNGVTSAYRAGCQVVMVPDQTKPDAELQKMLTACVDSLDQMKALFQ